MRTGVLRKLRAGGRQDSRNGSGGVCVDFVAFMRVGESLGEGCPHGLWFPSFRRRCENKI